MFSLYNLETGFIRAQYSSLMLAEASQREGEGVFTEVCDPDRHLIVNGVAEPKPRPAFDYMSLARDLRNRYLLESDWTQVIDNQLSADTRATWASYRQSLRDFPQTVLSAGATTEDEVRDLVPDPPQ